jgi:hypothetical protein
MPRPGSGVVHPRFVASIEAVAGTTRPESAQLQEPQRANRPSGQTNVGRCRRSGRRARLADLDVAWP